MSLLELDLLFRRCIFLGCSIDNKFQRIVFLVYPNLLTIVPFSIQIQVESLINKFLKLHFLFFIIQYTGGRCPTICF